MFSELASSLCQESGKILDKMLLTLIFLFKRLFQDIVVRLLFILGNLLSVIERAQWQLFQAPGIVASFQDIFEHFLNFRHLVRQEKVNDSSPLSEDNVSVSDSGTERSESIRTQQVADIEDVLVKVREEFRAVSFTAFFHLSAGTCHS